MIQILERSPLNLVSTCVGMLARIPVPGPFRSTVISVTAALLGARLEEAEHGAGNYGSVAEFFTRSLKSGLRPIGEGLVSPVDGTLRGFGRITSGQLEQIKVKSYALDELVGSTEEAQWYQAGSFINLYLAPKDYHHVHSPFDATIGMLRHIPGKLLPVQDWTVRSIDRLFAKNERIVMHTDSKFGKICIVMVGAMNVGSMSVSFDGGVLTNCHNRQVSVKNYSPAIELKKGERIGTFNLGSTVVLLTERPLRSQVNGEPLAVRYGQALAEF